MQTHSFYPCHFSPANSMGPKDRSEGVFRTDVSSSQHNSSKGAGAWGTSIRFVIFFHVSSPFFYHTPSLVNKVPVDADTETLRWQHPIGNGYVGAVIHNESIYVSSRDQHLYALEKDTGGLRWKYTFGYQTFNTAIVVGTVVYINIDGAFALNSVDCSLLWHKHYPSSIAPLAVVTSAFSSFDTGQSNGKGT